MPDDLPELKTEHSGQAGGPRQDKLTDKTLKLGYWFITHQILLKKILTGIIIAIASVFWIYALVGFVDWAFIRGPKERENLNTILQIKTHSDAIQSIKGEPLSFGGVETFAGGIGKYDLFSQLSNSNKRWWAEFEYRFVGEGYTGNWKKGFILPSEKKYITDLGVERAFRPRNVRLETKSIKYQRIDAHKISDYSKWAKNRFNFKIADKKFDPNAIQNKKKIASLNFKVTNDTAYNYWSIGFYALLYRGEQLVAINYLSAEQLKSGKARDLQMFF